MANVRVGENRIEWNGDGLKQHVRMTAKQRLALTAESVTSQVKRNISVGRPASKPGEFPHVDTGRLRNSIFWDFQNNTTAIVGTPVKYGLYLELGTSKMAARPFLRPTLEQMRTKIERLFAS